METGNNVILYYSKKCTNSMKLLREYNLNGYKLVNIDTEKYPSIITCIPCIQNNAGQILFGKNLFDLMEKNDNVMPFQFGHTNNMNCGFSFIDSDNEYYCEPEPYTPF